METDVLFTIIRESVSLGILIVVLVGGYRLANKLIDVLDTHQNNIEDILADILTHLKSKSNA